MKIGIYYGSNTGATGEVAEKVAKALGVTSEVVHDVTHADPAGVADYDLIVLGASTHGAGDVQSDMEDFLAGVVPLDLKGKKIALFGTGDVQMTDTFCNAVGEMYDRLQGTGAIFVGSFPASCYEFDHSDAMRGDQAVGLLLDDQNHPQLTDERISQWAELIKK